MTCSELALQPIVMIVKTIHVYISKPNVVHL